MTKTHRTPPKRLEDQRTTRSRTTQNNGEPKTITFQQQPPTTTTQNITPNVHHDSDVSSSPISTASSSQFSPDNYKYTLKNLPQNYSTQKTLYGLLVQINTPIHILKVNWNRTALLSTSTQLTSRAISKIQIALNSPQTTISPIGTRNPRPQTPRLATYSCVVRNVDAEITPDDVAEALEALQLAFTKTVRITSRATGRPTPLFRIISTDTKTIDRLIASGLPMFGAIHTCEPSHAPKPIALQCQKCFSFGHDTQNCTNKLTCPKCSGNHRLDNCTSDVTKCPACNMDTHIAFSHKCPTRTAIEITNDTPVAPLKPIDTPAEHETDLEHDTNVRVSSLIRFLTFTLLNLFPHDRERIGNVITTATLQFFGVGTSVAYSGNRVHVGVF